MKQTADSKPIFFKPSNIADRRRLRRLFRVPSIRIIDTYTELLGELCEIRHPSFRGNALVQAQMKQQFIADHARGRPLEQVGLWVYFPWRHAVAHVLPPAWHEEIRTARNRNLITALEQKQYRRCVVAVAGLSVGSHAAVSIALQGGAEAMRLADADTISGSNLNRLRTGVTNLGVHKADAVAREIYEFDPFAKLKIYRQGLSAKNCEQFVRGAGVIVEEIDNLSMKFLIREYAKKYRIPVVSATDNGDGILLDVERYDLDSTTKPFGGRAEGITAKTSLQLSPQEMVQVIAKLLDPQAIAPRMMSSALEVGKTLYSWPQLGGAAMTAGTAVAYAVRMIATNGPLPSGRSILSFERLISKNSIV